MNRKLIIALAVLPMCVLAENAQQDVAITKSLQQRINNTKVSSGSSIVKPQLSMQSLHSFKAQNININNMPENRSRITNIVYSPDKVVTIYANPFITTTIVFGKDETITKDDITNGDSASWMYENYESKPNYLALKPVRVGSDTSMTIVTNKHTYYFHLISSDKYPAMFAIKFLYPNEKLADSKAQKKYLEGQEKANLSPFINPKHLNMNYTFSGDKSVMPIQVWDNGTVTYMQFLPNQPQPAIFAVNDKDGDEAVVNYRRLPNNLVEVLKVSPQFTLRLGSEHVASIFNKTYIDQIKKGQSVYHIDDFFKSAIKYVNPMTYMDDK